MNKSFGNIANFDKNKLSDSTKIKKNVFKAKPKEKKEWEVVEEEGIKINASTERISESQCLEIIAHWKRMNEIKTESKDVDGVITDYIDDFIYRLITIPKSLQCDKFETGKVKNGKAKKEKKFKSAIYFTESEFIENFVNFTDLHEEERGHYADLVDIVQNARPKVDFESEFVLVLHLGISQTVVVDLEKSLQTAKIFNNSLHLRVITNQRRKWARYSSFVWCVVINKKKQFENVKAHIMNFSFGKSCLSSVSLSVK